MSYWKGLEVRTLGAFEMSFEGAPVHLGMKLSAKPIQVFLMLLDSREAGVSRQRLIGSLFEGESEADATNSLNVAVSRLRKLLKNSDLPDEKYIHVKLDRYFFECPFPVSIDTERVMSFRKASDLSKGQTKVTLLYQLCDLYYGRFLPELDGEDWVEVSRAHYSRIFRTSMDDLCTELEGRGAYGEIIRLAQFASSMFPLDEWQAWELRSLVALGRIREANELYHDIEAIYAKEYGTLPPERIRTQLAYEAEDVRAPETPLHVREGLGSKGGPTYLPLSSLNAAAFMVSGEPDARRSCILFTLDAGEDDLQDAMDDLECSMFETLLEGDAFGRYSRCQFLAIAPEGAASSIPSSFESKASSTSRSLRVEFV